MHMIKYTQLTQRERYLITHYRGKGFSQARIAHLLGRSPSTVSRELARNRTNHDGDYRAQKAHSYAIARRRRCRRGSQYSAPDWLRVTRLLRQRWSPEQVSGVLKLEQDFHISHETIYRFIRRDRKHGGTLFRYMRGMTKRHMKRHTGIEFRGHMPGKRHISERPAEVETRQTLGHWEGDTVIGQDKFACLLTLVERKSGLAIIKKLTSRTVVQTNKAACKAISRRPGEFNTLTFDNGTEFHGFKLLEKKFGVTCYFATPYHSWERGSNENLNGLIRQYVPKGTCMKDLTQKQCNNIAHALNNRPRKRHNFKTPLDVYNA
jgi:transposase, IS30 family